MASFDPKDRVMQNIRLRFGGRMSSISWGGRGRRWRDFIDLLPGFASLEADVAHLIYANTGDITYHRAVSAQRNDVGGEWIGGHQGIGFIEIPIKRDKGRILLSPELQRAYLYSHDAPLTEKPRAIASALMAGAGWNDYHIYERGVLKAGEEIPYHLLAAEIAAEHYEVRRNAFRPDSIARPYFTEDLIAYYVDAGAQHQEKYLEESNIDQVEKETKAAQLCADIVLALSKLAKSGVKKLTLEKAEPYQYEDVHRRLLTMTDSQEAGPKPVETEWRRSRLIFQRVRSAAPALIVGGLTGAAVRTVAQFSMAALLTTTPGIVAIMGSAVLAGALAGGASKFVTTAMFDLEGRSDPHWRRKVFLKGAAFGALGGLIGASAAHWLLSHNVNLPPSADLRAPSVKIPNLLSATSVAPAPPTYFIPDPVDVDLFSPNPEIPETVTSGAAIRMNPILSPLMSQSPAAAIPEIATTPLVDAASLPPGNNVRALLTQRQFYSLPKHVRALASSHDPRQLMQFCKEASYRLINRHPHGMEAMRAGQRLLGCGVHYAQTSHSHTRLAQTLYADYAYTKAWGIGGEASMTQAIESARLSGHAVHNYGARLLNLLRMPASG